MQVGEEGLKNKSRYGRNTHAGSRNLLKKYSDKNNGQTNEIGSIKANCESRFSYKTNLK